MQQRRVKIKYTVPFHETTGIIDQGREGSCVDITLADMSTIIFRMIGVFLLYPLTPQIGIDRRGGLAGSMRMCYYKKYGLEELRVYPYSKLSRKIVKDEEWTRDKFETDRNLRYRIKYIGAIYDKALIEAALFSMYSPSGFGYPIVGLMYMGRFEDPAVARHHAGKGQPPYRHSPDAELGGVKHALLIVGMNTMSDNRDEHYCEVKNSFGKDWGLGGYSKVAIEVFESILYPKQPRLRRRQPYSQEDKTPYA